MPSSLVFSSWLVCLKPAFEGGGFRFFLILSDVMKYVAKCRYYRFRSTCFSTMEVFWCCASTALGSPFLLCILFLYLALHLDLGKRKERQQQWVFSTGRSGGDKRNSNFSKSVVFVGTDCRLMTIESLPLNTDE